MNTLLGTFYIKNENSNWDEIPESNKNNIEYIIREAWWDSPTSVLYAEQIQKDSLYVSFKVIRMPGCCGFYIFHNASICYYTDSHLKDDMVDTLNNCCNNMTIFGDVDEPQSNIPEPIQEMANYIFTKVVNALSQEKGVLLSFFNYTGSNLKYDNCCTKLFLKHYKQQTTDRKITYLSKCTTCDPDKTDQIAFIIKGENVA